MDLDPPHIKGENFYFNIYLLFLLFFIYIIYYLLFNIYLLCNIYLLFLLFIIFIIITIIICFIFLFLDIKTFFFSKMTHPTGYPRNGLWLSAR